MIEPGPRRLVLGPQAVTWRRQLGPSAWCLLGTLAAHAVDHDGRLILITSVRSLAASTGTGRNTIDRAFRRLRAEGLVHAAQSRSDRGAFGRGCYVLELPADALLVETTPTAGGGTPDRRPKARRADEQQVLLLDADGVEENVGGYATSFDRQVPTGRQ